MRRHPPFALLLTALLLGNFTTLPFSTAASSDGSTGGHELFGFWTTADEMRTTLLIPNPTNQSHELLLELFDEKGKRLIRRPFELEAAGSIRIPIDSLIEGSELGYLRLGFPDEVCILPAQAVIESGEQLWSFDLKDTRVMGGEGTRIEALLYSLPDEGRQESQKVPEDVFILTNLSDEKQNGELVSHSDGRESRKKWALFSGQTKLVKLKSQAGTSGGASRVEFLPDDPTAELLVSGLRSIDKHEYSPIHFRVIAPGSGEMAGFYAGEDSTLQLWNLDDEPVAMELELIDERGMLAAEERLLPAGQSLDLPLREITDLNQVSKGTVIIRFPAEAILAGQIAAADSANATMLKDTARETSLSYSLPIYINDTTTTRVRIFNPNDEEVPLCLFLFFGEEGFTYPLKMLGPRQYVEVDLQEARNTALAGEIGRTIPLDADIGQAKIVLHPAPGAEPPARKFVAMGVMENLASEQKVAFQGCTSCPPVLHQVNFNPSSITGFVGSERRVRVMATYSDGGIKWVDDVTSSAFTYSLNPSIASVTRDQVRFNRAGFTSLEARVFDCTEVEVYEPSGFFPVMECFCSEFGYEYGQASVRSKSTRFTVHMKAFIPYNNVSAPSPEAVCLFGFLPRTLVYNGNDRNFSSSLSASYKARLVANVAVAQSESSSGLVTSSAGVGPTHSFASDVFDNNNRIDQSEYDSRLFDCHFWHQQDQAGASGINVSVQRLNPSKIKVIFTGSAKIPLIRLAPSIDWSASLTLDSSGENLKWDLQGTHDGFPAYEFYLNGTPLYQDAPTSPLQIIYLFDGAGDENFRRQGEIK